ncbi:MAG: hypothetical protein MHMPM18_000267 [Marteilia pararefringens]
MLYILTFLIIQGTIQPVVNCNDKTVILACRRFNYAEGFPNVKPLVASAICLQESIKRCNIQRVSELKENCDFYLHVSQDRLNLIEMMLLRTNRKIFCFATSHNSEISLSIGNSGQDEDSLIPRDLKAEYRLSINAKIRTIRGYEPLLKTAEKICRFQSTQMQTKGEDIRLNNNKTISMLKLDILRDIESSSI